MPGVSMKMVCDVPVVSTPWTLFLVVWGLFMMKVAQNTLKEVDLVLFMINAEEGYGKGDEFIIVNARCINENGLRRAGCQHPLDFISCRLGFVAHDGAFSSEDLHDERKL
jgi:hypothetical protein